MEAISEKERSDVPISSLMYLSFSAPINWFRDFPHCLRQIRFRCRELRPRLAATASTVMPEPQWVAV